eukprot:gene5650-8955_t
MASWLGAVPSRIVCIRSVRRLGNLRTTIQNTQGQHLFSLAGPLIRSRRSASTGAIASIFLLTRRAILYPAIVISGIGAAAGEVKRRMPEFELPPGINDLSQGVDSLFDLFKSEMANVRERMSPGITQHMKSTSVVAVCEGSDTAEQPKLNSKPDAGTDKPDDGKRSVVHPLQSELTQAEEEIQRLQTALDHLRDEKDTEIALLNEQLADLQERLNNANDEAQQQLAAERAHLQKVIDQLKKENEELNRLQILRTQKGVTARQKRAIDLFSEILELRSQLDSAFDVKERLPRVVVVGDQSAGKTSVLEVLVRARIFPRGAGEMMTRSPIQVTMSEGPHHIARFHGDSKVFNLRSEHDLSELRRQIEARMLNSLIGSDVVSTKSLVLELEGPGLQPMVLVDLPGIIQHHTQGMPETTKQNIMDMCSRHITNPNSIILCIQDASRDAESSSVADMVRTADPEGDRTVFVLTKVDLAEKLAVSRQKLKDTLAGDRFNMRARAYFAVITGTSNPNESIDIIRKAERDYFSSSQLMKSVHLGSEKLGTDNLSRTVSDMFWERVRETVAQEGMLIARTLKRKETEWKNNYPNQARLSRDDLFNMGRHQILQNITAFNDTMTPAQWEMVLTEQ